MHVLIPGVLVCLSSLTVGVIYVTVIVPIIALMAVLVTVVFQILLLPITVLTGNRLNVINIQQVFNELMPTPLRFFQRLCGAITIGRTGPSRRHTAVVNQHRPGWVRSVRGIMCDL